MKLLKVLGAIVLVLAVLVGFAAIFGGDATPASARLTAGQVLPALSLKNIHGKEVAVPAKKELVHLQFRRFAQCPICNLHLQDFIHRNDELTKAGIKEVVFFHSSDAELLPYQGKFPFDVIGDPDKKYYHQFGVGTSIWAILSPHAWSAIYNGNMAKDKPAATGHPNGGPLGLPADFLIASDGTVKAVHYGKNANDAWTVDEVLALAKK